MFSIHLNNEEFESENDRVVLGLLIIESFSESFHAPLSYWDKNKYFSQWKEAVQRLLNGEKHSALVTTMYEPCSANFIYWWVMYLIGDKVHIQNHVLFLNDLERPFDETDIYSFIPERETHNEEGTHISEWVTDISTIAQWIDTR